MAFVWALAGAAVTSHLMFGHQPPAQPEDVVIYLAALGAAVIAGWWLTNVIAWSVALRRGIQLKRFTLPGTKRIAQLTLAITLSSSCVAEATNDPVMVLVEQGDASATTLPPITAPTTTTSAVSSTAVLSTAVPSTAVPSTAVPVEDTDTEQVEPPAEEPPTDAANPLQISIHQVVANEGDNLWSMASDTLELNGVTSPTPGQVAQYWRLVVAANQVRSGNPDLIVIGEAITMPAFDMSRFAAVTPDRSAQPSQAVGIAVR